MTKSVFFTVVLMCILGCKGNDCTVDKNLELDFKSNLKTIEDFESGKAVGVSNYLNSLSYFTKLTGHKSQVKIGGAIGYGDSIKLNHDLVEWNKWYDLNKCHMTKAKVDSVLGDYKFQDD